MDAIKALRKERVAELKVDKERLEGALREKNHAEKLKNRIADLNATIISKDAEYDDLKTRAETLSIQNKEFYERATKFRDTFRNFENAQNRKETLESDYRDISEALEILEGEALPFSSSRVLTKYVGSDAELETRRNNFEHHMNRQKASRDRKMQDLQDEEERLVDIQRQLGEEQKREGQLLGEEQAYQRNLAKRDTLVRDISKKHGLKGFDSGSLDAQQWEDFRSRMDQIQQKAKTALEATQVCRRLG